MKDFHSYKNRSLTKEEIEHIVQKEKEKAIQEGFLEEEDIKDYLDIVREEVEAYWTYQQYCYYLELDIN